MSKANKVNKGNYDQAGRLTPDDMARERQKQAQVTPMRDDITNRAPAAPSRRDEPESSRPRSAPEE